MMRVIGSLLCAVFLCAGQEAVNPDAAASPPHPHPKDPELVRLQELADQVTHALAAENVTLANRLAADLSLSLSRRDKVLAFADAERQIPASGPDRVHALSKAVMAACEAADFSRAVSYAQELLSIAANDPKDEDFGHALYYGNLALGRVALERDHDMAEAKAALLRAGKTPGSRVLGSFGPNMTLAQELLAIGEREAVLAFFAECRSFWKYDHGALNAWTADVNSCCKMPKFGANLVY